MKTYKVQYTLAPNVTVTVVVEAKNEELALQRADFELDDAMIHGTVGPGLIVTDN